MIQTQYKHVIRYIINNNLVMNHLNVNNFNIDNSIIIIIIKIKSIKLPVKADGDPKWAMS